MKQKTGRKLLGILLTLAMVVGLLPGMSLTAYAAGGDMNETLNLYTIGTGQTNTGTSTFSGTNIDAVGHDYDSDGWNLGYDSSNVEYTLKFIGKNGAKINKVVLNMGYLSSNNPMACITSNPAGTITIDGKSLTYEYSTGSSNVLFGFTQPSGVALGDAFVQVKTATVYYTLTSVNATGVTLDKTAAQTIDVDGTVSFTATVEPDNATDKTVKWSVGGTDAGAVKLYTDADCTAEVGADASETLTVYAKGISAGSATVTCTSNADSSKSASCAVTVNETQQQSGGTDVLTREDTGRTGTSYGEWSGVTKSSGAVYAGLSAGDHESIQLRSNNNNSGIVTTTSGGKATKVRVVWNSNTTNGRTLNVYGKNSAYSAASDLYGGDQGDLLGTIVCGQSTELTISGDYTYIGMRSNSSAMYLDSIAIEWGGSTPATVAVTGVTLNPSAAQTIDLDGKVSFTATVAPDNATDKKVKWSVGGTDAGAVKLYSDETCENEIGADATETLTVYAKGISAGSATVTAASNADSEKTASCAVTVNAPTALAYDGNPYASLVGTTTSVTFNGKPWYIIADNSTAVDAGTVTLLAADTSFGLSAFSDSFSNDYSKSKVKDTLDALTTSGSFKDVADAIVTNTDAGGKLYLLSTSEAQQLSSNVLKMNFSSMMGGWWLRSPGSYAYSAAFVLGEYGDVDGNVSYVSKEFGVRPALKLDLSKVTFDSESRTFATAAPALDPVPYMAWDESAQALVEMTDDDACKDYTVVTNSEEAVTWKSGWYVVPEGTVTLTGGVKLDGDVHLILCDGATLNVTNNGIMDSTSESSIAIYAQSTGETMGRLSIDYNENVYYALAAVEGITINGGVVDANGAYFALFAGDSITVNGGAVTATTNAESSKGITADTVNINGGALTATANGADSFGIDAFGDGFIINGGTVTASGTRNGIYEENSVTVASGLTVKAGDDEASATVIDDPSNWAHTEKWVKIEKAPPKTDQAAPTDLTATKASSSTAADGKISGVTDTMEYQKDGDSTWTAVEANKTEITGLTAGTYKVRYAETADKNASPAATVEVGAKAAPTVTAPTAKTLTYNGQAQELVTAGSTDGGEMQYALGTATEATEPYTTSIPAKTNADTYYVWYKVVGDSNHNDIAPTKVDVTIAKAAQTVTLDPSASPVEWLFPDNKTFSAATNGGGELSVSSSKTEVVTAVMNNGVVTMTPHKDGTATITVHAAETANYNAGSANIAVTVNKGQIDLTATPASGLVYNGQAQDLVTVTVSKPEGATVKFGVDTDECTADTAQATNAGTYTVNYKVTKDYYETESGSFTVTIAPKAVTVTADTDAKTYGEADPQLTATVEGTLGEDTVNYNVTREAGEDAGDYTITASGEKLQGNYEVTYVTGTFTINVKTEAEGTEDQPATETVAEITLTPTKAEDANYQPAAVVVDGKTLVEGTDYTVAYTYDPDGKTGTATFTFQGNYSGVVAVPFDQPEYKVIETDNATVKDGNTTITATGMVRINGDIARFNAFEDKDNQVLVDGKAVAPSNYTVKSGSTIITFKDKYLSSLTDGKHDLTVYFVDGKAETTLTVSSKTTTGAKSSKSNAPKTGDANTIALYGGLMAASLAGAGALIVTGKKRKDEE